MSARIAGIMWVLSPLSDPVFLLQWQVHVVVVSLFAIFGAWWGLTRRPWYVRPTMLLGSLLLFVPLEAPDPAFILLVATPILAAICRGIGWYLEHGGVTSSSQAEPTQSPWRFRLSDALWLTFIIGLGCALLTQLWRLPWPSHRAVSGGIGVHWPGLGVNAICLFAVAAAVVIASRQTTFLRWTLASVAVLLTIGTAAGLQQALVQHDLLLLKDWGAAVDAAFPKVPSIPRQEWLVFNVYLRTFVAFATILSVGLLAVVPSVGTRFPRLWAAARIFGGYVLAVLLLGLSVVYIEMLKRPQWPAERFPARNRRPELQLLVARHDGVNPRHLSIDELRKTVGQPTASEVATLFKELDELLQQDEITWFDSRSDKPDATYSASQINEIRALHRALRAQAVADWSAGRRRSALDHDLLALRLSATLQRRGTGMHALPGSGFEGYSLARLAEIRKELTLEERRLILHQLRQITASRESPALLWKRDAVYDALAHGWQGRLAAAAHRLRGVPTLAEQIGHGAFRRRDAMLALLQTDLAIRCYQEKYGRLPSDLSALVPEYLANLPLDPYADESLIYEANEGGFVLYSVGKDGHDDGGRFGNIDDVSKSDQLDLDLDSWSRQR